MARPILHLGRPVRSLRQREAAASHDQREKINLRALCEKINEQLNYGRLKYLNVILESI